MLSQDFSMWLEAESASADSSFGDSASHEILSGLRDTLCRHPVARLELATDGFVLHPNREDGFIIKVIPTQDQPILAFAGWHDELDWDVCQAYIEAALSGNLRVRADVLNNKPWKWTLEIARPEGEWAELACVSSIRLPFWKRDIKTHYFQFNRPADSYRANFAASVEAARYSARLG